MAKGVLDLWVSSDVDESSMTLVTDCFNGYPHDLDSLQDGVHIRLTKGSSERYVKIIRETDTECTFHYMELHPQTAAALGLQHGSRYQVRYDEENRTMKLAAHTVSRTSATVQIDRRRTREKHVVIGYTLLSILGVAGLAKSQITIKRGAAADKLRLLVPENELEEVFVLPYDTAAKLGLARGGKQIIEYDHSERVLRFPGNKIYSEPAGTALRGPARNNSAAIPSKTARPIAAAYPNKAAFPQMSQPRTAVKPVSTPVLKKTAQPSGSWVKSMWLNPNVNIKRPLR